jgi:hypothetical protein
MVLALKRNPVLPAFNPVFLLNKVILADKFDKDIFSKNSNSICSKYSKAVRPSVKGTRGSVFNFLILE